MRQHVLKERWTVLFTDALRGINHQIWGRCFTSVRCWDELGVFVVEVDGSDAYYQVKARLEFTLKHFDNDPLKEIFANRPEDRQILKTARCRRPCCMEELCNIMNRSKYGQMSSDVGRKVLGTSVMEELESLAEVYAARAREISNVCCMTDG